MCPRCAAMTNAVDDNNAAASGCWDGILNVG